MIQGAFIKALSSFLPATITFSRISTLEVALSLFCHRVCAVSVPGGTPATGQRAVPCSGCAVGGSREQHSQTALFQFYTGIKLHQQGFFFFFFFDEDCYYRIYGQKPRRLLTDTDWVEGNFQQIDAGTFLSRVGVCHRQIQQTQFRSSMPPPNGISEIYMKRV